MESTTDVDVDAEGYLNGTVKIQTMRSPIFQFSHGPGAGTGDMYLYILRGGRSREKAIMNCVDAGGVFLVYVN